MKRLGFLFIVLFSLSTQIFASSPSFYAGTDNLNIEIVPLKLKTDVNVLGLHLGVDGSQAILLTGEVAKEVFEAAGYVADETIEALLITGKGAADIVKTSIGTGLDLGENIIVTGADFSKRALDFSFKAVQKSGTIIQDGTKGLAKFTVQTLDAVVLMSEGAVTLVTDSGIYLLNKGSEFLGDILGLLKGLFGKFFDIFK